MKEAICRMTGKSIEIFGASRTDSGAHALGQVVHFDGPLSVPIEAWKSALNRYLPDDLRIESSHEVGNDFHCRFSAKSRTYHYCFCYQDTNPFIARYSYLFHQNLNKVEMQKAIELLKGKHDFRAFTEELPSHIENTVRELFQLQWIEDEHQLKLEVTGTAFLRGMMRRIAGLVFEIGRGYRPVEDVFNLLSDNRNNFQWAVILPAKGLHLIKVEYDDPPIDWRSKIQLSTLEDF